MKRFRNGHLILIILVLVFSLHLSCAEDDEGNLSDSDKFEGECKNACHDAVNCFNEVFPGSGYDMDDCVYGCNLIYQISESCGDCWVDCMNSEGSCDEKAECANVHCKEDGGPCDL